MDECMPKKVWSLKTVHVGIYKNCTLCSRRFTSKLSQLEHNGSSWLVVGNPSIFLEICWQSSLKCIKVPYWFLAALFLIAFCYIRLSWVYVSLKKMIYIKQIGQRYKTGNYIHMKHCKCQSNETGLNYWFEDVDDGWMDGWIVVPLIIKELNYLF